MYGRSFTARRNGFPDFTRGSHSWVIFSRGTMPMVAKVKNMEEKKNRKPCTSPLDEEPEGLKSTRSEREKLPPEAPLASAAIAFSVPMMVFSSLRISASRAVFVLSTKRPMWPPAPE